MQCCCRQILKLSAAQSQCGAVLLQTDFEVSCSPDTGMCMHVCVHACVCVCICVHACECICVHACECICVHACVCVCVRARVCARTQGPLGALEGCAVPCALPVACAHMFVCVSSCVHVHARRACWARWGGGGTSQRVQRHFLPVHPCPLTTRQSRCAALPTRCVSCAA